MKLLSYGAPGSERAGWLDGDRVVDLASALQPLGIVLEPPTLLTFLALPDWGAVLPDLTHAPVAAGVALDATRLGAPIARPGNVFVVGANTYSHLAEARVFTHGEPPKEPMLLAKASSAVSGPFDPLIKPAQTEKLDYEVELGVVIGRTAHALPEDEALSAVAGYVVVNDVSARDVQLAEGEDNTFYRTHYLGKSFDTFCPTGPWMVTPDEVGDVGSLSLRTWVNGTIRQDGSTADLVFGVRALIAHLSSVMTLQPGDLICTGSPAGVAAFGPPSGFLVAGDVVRCEVGGIGSIENRVVAAVTH
jgi:2-keto-4-pentenoate hydratase/2-oxohepta-3-ene-1,7-dioic acid hydratase in catechol pathway